MVKKVNMSWLKEFIYVVKCIFKKIAFHLELYVVQFLMNIIEGPDNVWIIHW